MINPTVLYVVGVALVGIMTVILGLSMYYYSRAKDIAPFLHQVDDLQRRIADGQNTLAAIDDQKRAMLTEIARAEKLIADGKIAEEWLRENEPKLEGLRIAIEREQARLKEIADNRQKRQDELDALTQQVANKHFEQDDLTRQLDEKKIELRRVGMVLQDTQSELDEKKEAIKKLSPQLDTLKKEKFELESQIAALRQQAESQESKLRQLQGDITKTKADLEKIRLETVELEGRASASRTVLAEWAASREMNKERWQDLDRPFIPKDSGRTHKAFAEDQWLAAFDASLQKHGLVFNQRAIYAFHTGLKCAEISPLVVLAGISGTGKSLLPELYAAALGMNFLSMAVQPRWDSPQDMFGFYNYMEGRYKATELSRLLWQFDRYNNPEAKKRYQKQIPMNLVLLDEMNLARVEYYFSDLLSKLEIRHGLNYERDEERRKAEVEIECNAAAQNDQTRRLFVSLSTLFIGTMNEDESTQTLSDKVLDRANVIRFGRPKDLAKKPDKEGFLHDCGNQPRTDFANWREWCADRMQPGDTKRLETTINELNEAMTAVGRPFGHRVNQAITKYVACYPGTNSNAALADQIEMKILPKLNGLDGQANGFDTVMNKIEGVIDKLRDDNLHSSFRTARGEAADSFFKWRGVMR